MKPPDNVQLYETPISTHWFDEDGIFCAVSKKVERSVEHYQKLIDLYKMVVSNGNKLCLLSDASNSMPQSKEVREFIAVEMPKYVKAHAVITSAPLQATLTNTFVKLSMSGFQIKLFSNEKEAKEWLKEYLE